MSEPGWRGFFERLKDCSIKASYYAVSYGIDVETLYQVFKARLQAEQDERHDGDNHS